MSFLPELVLSAGLLALFVVCLGEGRTRQARQVAGGTAILFVGAVLLTFHREALLFDGTYRVDLFTQVLKLVLGLGYGAVVLLSDALPDVRPDVRPEFHLFTAVCVAGLVTLVSCVDLVALVVALELSSFPLYALVAMRQEAEQRRMQMEAAMKYMIFGITATGVMLFGMSYLFGLTGTTSLLEMPGRLEPWLGRPLVWVALALTWAGLFYKLAVFPFHFWTPDVYQGAAHEVAGLVASLPKLGAAAVLVRLTALAMPESQVLVGLLTALAVASMFYGNLIALWQTDVKRLLGFSGIAHAGYAVAALVALNEAGYTAALYYMAGYLFMVLACFVVVCGVATDGANVSLADLAGLHRRAPLLMVTLLVGVFALAGVPPFVGFMGKLAILKALWAREQVLLALVLVINSAIAAYYYLVLVREACFREVAEGAPLRLSLGTKALCIGLIGVIVGLGVAPGGVLQAFSDGVVAVLKPAAEIPGWAGPQAGSALWP